MPIDPVTGTYKSALGNESPGGGFSSALGILSDMLASNIAGTARQGRELDVAQKQNDYDQDQAYQGEVSGLTDQDQISDAAFKYLKPAQAVTAQTAGERLRIRQTEADDRVRAKKQDATNRLFKVATDAGWSNAKTYAVGAQNGLFEREDADAVINGPRANEIFSPVAAANIAQKNAAATKDTAAAGLSEAKTLTENELRDVKKKKIQAEIGLDVGKVAFLKQKVAQIKEAQKSGAGKVNAKQWLQVIKLKESLAKAALAAKQSVGGAKFMATEQDRQDAGEAINDYEHLLRDLNSDMAGVQVEGGAPATTPDFSDVVKGTDPSASTPSANSANTATVKSGAKFRFDPATNKLIPIQ